LILPYPKHMDVPGRYRDYQVAIVVRVKVENCAAASTGSDSTRTVSTQASSSSPRGINRPIEPGRSTADAAYSRERWVFGTRPMPDPSLHSGFPLRGVLLRVETRGWPVVASD
jgi:hypothetical protein